MKKVSDQTERCLPPCSWRLGVVLSGALAGGLAALLVTPTYAQNESEVAQLVRDQISPCWNVPAGPINDRPRKATVRFKLTPAGEIDGTPQIVSGEGTTDFQRAVAEAARRAVVRCAPYTLPAEKYKTWADITVKFDPRDMSDKSLARRTTRF